MTRTARLKRSLIGLAIGATVFGGVYGFAASLGVTSDSLGAGSTAVAACQPTAVNVTYTTTYVVGSSYDATTVTLNGITAPCNGKAVSITVSGAGGAVLGQQSGLVSGTTYATTLTGVSAASVTGVHAVISG